MLTERSILQGKRASPAVPATMDLPEVPVDPCDIEDGVIMTRLDVRLAPKATIGQVNDALSAAGAGIVSMSAGSPFVTVGVPRAASVAALHDLAKSLGAAQGILWASAGSESSPQILPFAAPGLPNRSLLPTRSPVAWNARHLAVDGCDSRKVPILVADNFIRPDPYAEFPVQVPGFFPSPPTEMGSPVTPTHGYDVVTTMAALFDDRNPTGANPFSQCLDVLGVQVSRLMPSQEIARIQRNFPPERFILKYSRGFRGNCTRETIVSGSGFVDHCEDASVDHIASAAERARWAEEWKKLTIGDWDRYLVASAAGNFRADPTEVANPAGYAATVYPGLGIARFASVFNIVTDVDPSFGFEVNAGLWQPSFPDENLTADASDVADLQATLAADGLDQAPRVDNVLITGSTTPNDDPAALIESAFSNVGPDVVAPGEQITMLNAPEQGTSFSAPQVSGLASYLWLLSDDLRNVQPASTTRRAILDNARDFPLAGKLVDACASAHLGVYLDANGMVLEPATKDYDRFDVNGDGFSGGSHTERFDLDRVGSTRYGAADYGTASQEIEGTQAAFNESEVTDLDVISYYAYSGLYTGDPTARHTMISGLCGASPIVVTFAWAGVEITPGGKACNSCQVVFFDHFTLDEDTPGRSIAAAEPSHTVTADNPATGASFSATASSIADGVIDRGPGGVVTLSGSQSGDGSAMTTRDAQGSAPMLASTEFQFTTSVPCDYTLEVTCDASGTDTSASFTFSGSPVSFDDTGGSTSGTLQPGSYFLDATVHEFAASDILIPSDADHIAYHFTLTLTPK